MNLSRQRARFITFEGGEGVGKSTQVTLLAERLHVYDAQVVATREPGGSPKAEAIRTLLLSGAIAPFGPAAEAMMFAAARMDHVTQRIAPALARGAWVVCDRFIDSTRAYQGVAGHVDAALIQSLETAAVGRLRPDLTIILDVPGREGLARAAARRGDTAAADRFERLDVAFHDRLRDAFLAIARDEPQRCVVVDAAFDAAAVAVAVWRAVEERLGVLGPERA